MFVQYIYIYVYMTIVTHEGQKRVLDHLDPELQMIENGFKCRYGEPNSGFLPKQCFWASSRSQCDILYKL